MAKPKPKTRPRTRTRKRKSRFSMDRGLVSVVMSILSLTLLGAALITESLLLLVVTALSALATALQVRWAQRRAADEVRKQARPRSRPKPTTKPTPPPSDSESSSGPAPAGGAVLCTDTAKRIEECGCASRHVASAEGARRYGLPIGSPMGRRAKAKRPAATVQSG